ncbi:MAG: hypothetical protein Q9169_007137 [Polycauliona sp. 2 TL-2023]
MEEANERADYGKQDRRYQTSLWRIWLQRWPTIAFVVPQSTGILASIIFQLNWQFKGSEVIAIVIWLLTIILFAIVTTTYILKSILFPQKVRSELTTDLKSLCFLASPSITFSTIISMLALVCAKAWGTSWGMVSYILNWINIFFAIAVSIGIPYTYIHLTPAGINNIPPTVLLPAIAPLTAASACGTVSVYGKLDADLQIPMIITGYMLLGLGLALAIMLLGVYMARLLNGGVPDTGRKVWMNYVTFGPLGQASAALQYLGTAASSPVENSTFASYNQGTFITANAGQILDTVGTLSGLLLWSFAAWWMLFSVTMTVHLGILADGGIQEYSLSAWSPVYPWGVLSLGAIQLGESMDSAAFKGIATTLESTHEGRTSIPQPIWTVASWLQERKRRFPRQIKHEEIVERKPKAAQSIRLIREAKHRRGAHLPAIPTQEAKTGETSAVGEVDTELESTMDLPTSRIGTPAHQTTQTLATSKKPKTPRSGKSDQKPDPTRQKKISLFARHHKFIMEQSLGTYTTTQRRAFERDVYDFARALGFSKARAKASMLGARTFCGEEAYDTDDTRLDDDEIDDSCEVLVALPLSTGAQTSFSSFSRSFSASSPSIPWSGNPARTGSEIIPSVEVRETPQSEGGKSKRTRKEAESFTSAPKEKRRKTDTELLAKTIENTHGDCGGRLRLSESSAIPASDMDRPQEDIPDVPSQHQINGDNPIMARILGHQIRSSTGDDPTAGGEQPEDDQPEKKDQQRSLKSSNGKNGKGKKQQSTPNKLPKTPSNVNGKRKSQQDGPQEQSTAIINGVTHAPAVAPNGSENQEALKTALRPHHQDSQANRVDTNGATEHSQAKEPNGLPTPEPQEEKETDEARKPPDWERNTRRESKKDNFDQFMDGLRLLEAEKKTRIEEGQRIKKKELPKSQRKKTAAVVVKQEVDNDFRERAQELLRSQNEARRVREEKVTAKNIDRGQDESADNPENTPLQHEEKKMSKMHIKMKRRAEQASASRARLGKGFHSPMIQSA